MSEPIKAPDWPAFVAWLLTGTLAVLWWLCLALAALVGLGSFFA